MALDPQGVVLGPEHDMDGVRSYLQVLLRALLCTINLKVIVFSGNPVLAESLVACKDAFQLNILEWNGGLEPEEEEWLHVFLQTQRSLKRVFLLCGNWKSGLHTFIMPELQTFRLIDDGTKLAIALLSQNIVRSLAWEGHYLTIGHSPTFPSPSYPPDFLHGIGKLVHLEIDSWGLCAPLVDHLCSLRFLEIWDLDPDMPKFIRRISQLEELVLNASIATRRAHQRSDTDGKLLDISSGRIKD
ncbi:hypothetical protein BKA70DRAFT_1417457 [Coprinopsis sp. MPI-PUGE-AT-0042]|nr:hypothetical protein BKA70DRAFT_1417457 [Coprinopsis sp. MPI-PUGE-AT-0042]